MKSISLRFRLVFWYSAIVTLTLLVFGIAAYLTVSKDLYQNLDASLERVATSLDFIIKKKQKETMQLRRGEKNPEEINKKSPIHLLFSETQQLSPIP
jgi:hypothetical protein